MVDYSTLNEKLNLYSKKALAQIFEEYGSYFNDEQKTLFANLLNKDFIKVEENSDRYTGEKAKNNEDITVPLAHGGRTFGDNIIHFYPFILNNTENIEDSCKEVLIHELFHYFIRPQQMQNTNEELSSFVTEGLVDMYTRDFCTKHSDTYTYKEGSNYGKNVIFVRDLLSSLGTEEDKNKASFQFGVQELFEVHGFDKSMEEYGLVAESKDKTYLLFDEIAQTFSKEHKDSIIRKLYNNLANCKSKEEMASSLITLISSTQPNHPQIEDLKNRINEILTSGIEMK